jgi:hypothetical protein
MPGRWSERLRWRTIQIALVFGCGILVFLQLQPIYVDFACRTPFLVRNSPFPMSHLCAFPVAADGDVEQAEALLSTRTAADLERRRAALSTYLWGTADLPRDLLPTSVRAGIRDERVAGLANLDHVDELETAFSLGFVARAYHLVPRQGNGRVVLYHEGHEGSFTDDGRDTVAALLAAGFAVLAFDMPMRGINSWPDSTDVPGLGPVPFGGGSHWDLAILESDDFLPLRLFVEPILRGVNHLERTARYELLLMTGLSGGGWSTVVYAALDPRVARSYPVAGTMPFHLRERHPISGRHESEGDYEQRLPGFYRLASYLDLYVMGASGAGRRQIQVLNKYDPCCFFGTRAETYAPAVAAAVRATSRGGSYRLVIDDTHEHHAISAHALRLILEDAAAPLCPVDEPGCGPDLVAQSGHAPGAQTTH